MKRFVAVVLASLMFLSTSAFASESLKYDMGSVLQQRVKHLNTLQLKRLKRAVKHHDLSTVQAMLKLNRHDIQKLNRLGKQKRMKLSRADKMKLFGSTHAKTMMLSTHEQAKTEGAFWWIVWVVLFGWASSVANAPAPGEHTYGPGTPAYYPVFN